MNLEAEYNNLAKVPGHPAIIAGWRRDAAAFRAAHADAELGLAYGPGEREKLDLFWPASGRGGAARALFARRLLAVARSRAVQPHGGGAERARGRGRGALLRPLPAGEARGDRGARSSGPRAFLHRRHGRPMLAVGHSAGGHLAAMLLAWDARVGAGGAADQRPL